MDALPLKETYESLRSDVDSGVLWAPVRAGLLTKRARRLEASTYLTEGFGLRQSLEVLPSTVSVSHLAAICQPSRLKGYPVDPEKGLPFLSAGQVFEANPRVRKWLATAMVPAVESRYVDLDWLLLSCSGEVGRVTAVYREHLGKVITHDLLRIMPRDTEEYGWLYAYMKTPTFFSIARSSQYGHMIKHLEPEHVRTMPVAMPEEAIRRRVAKDATAAVKMRRKARELQARADDLYFHSVNPENVSVLKSAFCTVSVSSLLRGRRRMEGQFHRADILQIEAMLKEAAESVQPLKDLVKCISMLPRFKRYFGENGTVYRSAAELFDVNPAVTKRIYAGLLENPDRYMLRPGEMVMARSGQTYGLLGRTVVLTENHDGIFGSEDLIRIVPDQERARSGYLQTVLNHVDYGRPRVVRYASGTSVPHLDPLDIREVLIPRLASSREVEIADLSDRATLLSAEADRLENKAIEVAENAISKLISRHGNSQPSS